MQRPDDFTGGGPDRTISLRGNVLVVTEDPDLLAAQLDGSGTRTAAELLREPLRDNISTDEIIPGWCCYWYDEKLGDYAYLGLRDRTFGEGAVKRFAPQIVVSGAAKGCGSSREHAVYAEKYSGVQLVFARSFERIYQQNCRNVGIVTCDDFDVLAALLDGEELPLEAFTRGANEIERAIIDCGGLFGFNREHRAHRAHHDGEQSAIRPAFSGRRPLNVVEKIIQSRLSPRNRPPGDDSVRIGESYFVETDVRFSHEYVTPMAAGMFGRQFGPQARLADPESCYFFQDHLSLADQVLKRREGGPELIARVDDLGRRQQEFAELAGGHFIGPSDSGGSRAICHNHILEHVAGPGDVIVGTDSHTCTAGAVGALAFGVGATDIANSWYNREILVKVPAVIRINLLGGLRPGVSAKDLMLALLAHPRIEGSQTLGKVLLFTGPGCAGLNIDERATLCNMAVEAGGMTALFEPDDVTYAYLAAHPRDARASASAPPEVPTSDADATYASVVDITPADVEPMVALPGDPRNAVPLASVREEVKVDKVYGGSCTGGKAYDMDMYADVFELARARGAKVPADVQAYIQVGSENVMRYAVERGYIALFEEVGVQVLPPSCGACINAGPGVSERPDEVTVSAQNRNFPGRSGPGQVYLASPYIVAATAIAGRLSSVEDMFGTGVRA
ncbi:aconitase family protein [Streptomyces aureocirculatus]|uniref:aconitase family protein n=1 Tax=Streptomyces aureocirculatus TaxID=67275 RepID=UPI00068D70BC|nr:aconitase family protein [Streptomyces aureocirculatus]